MKMDLKKFDFSKLKTEEKINYGAVGLIILALIILIFSTSSKIANINKVIAANDEQIANLTQELANTNTEEVPEVETVKGNYSSAEKIGKAVASYQNDYMTLPDSSSEEYEDAIKSISDEIGKYFSQNTKDQNARTPWYQANSEVPYKWEFMSNYSFSGNILPVLWICRGGDKIYAYATAQYDGKSEVFKNFNKTLTVDGSILMQSDEAPNMNSKKELTNLLNRIRDTIDKKDKNSSKDAEVKENTTPRYEIDAKGNLVEISGENDEPTKENEEYNSSIEDINAARWDNKERHESGEDKDGGN